MKDTNVPVKSTCKCQHCGGWYELRKDSPLVEPIEHECQSVPVEKWNLIKTGENRVAKKVLSIINKHQ